MNDKLTTALITSSITGGIYTIWKIVQHYRLKSSCNKDNQLVVEVVNVDESCEATRSKTEEVKSVEIEVKDKS